MRVSTLAVSVPSHSTRNMKVTAIPYYAWANRGEDEMTIWFPEYVRDIDLLTASSQKFSSPK